MKNSTDDSSNYLALIFYSIIESVDKKTNKTGEVEGKDGKVCPEDIHHHMKIFLIVRSCCYCASLVSSL